VRLLLDEMYPAAVATQLRARGRDVVSIHDGDHRWLEGQPDERVFAAALAEGRALVTENVPDYRRLEVEALTRGEAVPGLIFTTNRSFPRGQPGTVGRLVSSLDALLAERSELPTAVFLSPPTLS
jgi:Domain of unknown function (DUF5615)